jgi:hypothetical protein
VIREMTNQPLDIPPAWDKIVLREAHGLLMVIGATDTGKSTFAQYLYRRLGAEPGRRVAYLDGDPGQSRLGPPTTMTLALGKPLASPHPWEVHTPGKSQGHGTSVAMILSRQRANTGGALFKRFRRAGICCLCSSAQHG